jgi:hypothetical protein
MLETALQAVGLPIQSAGCKVAPKTNRALSTAKRARITSSTVVRPLRQAPLQTFVCASKRARDDDRARRVA